MHQRLHVVLKIFSHELLYYYEGDIDEVVAKTTDGRIIRFPAKILRSVVLSNGVKGTIELVFDENQKIVSIIRISD